LDSRRNVLNSQGHTTSRYDLYIYIYIFIYTCIYWYRYTYILHGYIHRYICLFVWRLEYMFKWLTTYIFTYIYIHIQESKILIFDFLMKGGPVGQYADTFRKTHLYIYSNTHIYVYECLYTIYTYNNNTRKTETMILK
jgi:hypothetical protein